MRLTRSICVVAASWAAVLTGTSVARADTAQLELVGQWGGESLAAAVSGDVAYAGTGLSLVTVDVTLSASPTRIGQVVLPGIVRCVAVSGAFAYVTVTDGSSAHLEVVDVSDPASPMRVGGCPVGGTAVAVSGSHVYVAAGSSGLEVVDVSDPTSPMPVGARDTGGNAVELAVSGDYAYVANSDSGGGLYVMDVSDPAFPVLVGAYPLSWHQLHGVAISGQYAYIVESDYTGGRLHVIDVATPAQPVAAGQRQIAGPRPHGVAVVGSYAYVVAQSPSLEVLDVSIPTSPVPLGSCSVGDAYAVAVSGNYAYVASKSAGLQVIAVSDPAAPVRAGEVVSGDVGTVAVSGNYAYVARGGVQGFQVLDISDSARPARVGGCDTVGDPRRSATSGNYVCLLAFSGESSLLQVVDVSDPTSPVAMGWCWTGGDSAADVAATGGYAYLAQNWWDGEEGLGVVDISDPASPVPVGRYATNGFATGVAVAGDYAYLSAGDGGLEVIDVSDPVLPIRVGQSATSGSADSVAISGSYAYLTSTLGMLDSLSRIEAIGISNSGLEVIDISNPISPVNVGQSEAVGTAFAVASSTTHAWVVSSAFVGFVQSGVEVFDIANPAFPVRIGGYTTAGNAADVAALSDHAYLADGEGGLAVLRVHPPGANDGDLVVTSVDTAGLALSGRSLHVTWQVTNADPARTVSGGFVDALYLSGDTRLDLGDIRMAVVPHVEPVGPAESYTVELDVVMPGVFPGQYYILAWTDASNQMHEPDAEHNNVTAGDPIPLDMAELILDIPETNDLTDAERARYYQVTVIEGEALHVRLDDLDDAGANELYASFEAVPTRSRFDYRYTTNFAADQLLVVPRTQGGSYYILAYASSIPEGAPSEFNIDATYVPLQVTSVTPDHMGNASPLPATVTIKGTRFIEGTTVLLRREAEIDVIPADITWVDSATIFAQFGFQGVPAGTWDLVVEDPDAETASSPFTVTEGGEPTLETELLLPSAVAFNRPATLWIDYANTGDVPMPAPLLELHGGQDSLLTVDPSLSGPGLATDNAPTGVSDTVQALAVGSGPSSPLKITGLRSAVCRCCVRRAKAC